MQVVAGKPLYLKAEEVPAELIAEQKAQFLAELKDSGKPQAVIEKAIEGKLEKFLEEICLLNQPFIKDTAVTIVELVRQKNALLGENLIVRRFTRFEVGG
jgi:elongation factor Ts